MDAKYIKELLDRYFEGETSLEEEQALRTYFQQAHIDPRVAPYADLFRYYQAAQMATYPGNRNKNDFHAPRTPKSQGFIWLSAAAVILIGLALGIYKTQVIPQAPLATVRFQDTYEDPNRAYEETRKALMMVSVRLNVGKKYESQLQKLNHIQDAQE